MAIGSIWHKLLPKKPHLFGVQDMAIGTFSLLQLVLNASYSPPTYIIYLVPEVAGGGILMGALVVTGFWFLVPSNPAMGVIWQ